MTPDYLSDIMVNLFTDYDTTNSAKDEDRNYARNVRSANENLREDEMYLRRYIEFLFYSNNQAYEGLEFDESVYSHDTDTGIITVNLFGETYLYIPPDADEEEALRIYYSRTSNAGEMVFAAGSLFENYAGVYFNENQISNYPYIMTYIALNDRPLVWGDLCCVATEHLLYLEYLHLLQELHLDNIYSLYDVSIYARDDFGGIADEDYYRRQMQELQVRQMNELTIALSGRLTVSSRNEMQHRHLNEIHRMQRNLLYDMDIPSDEPYDTLESIIIEQWRLQWNLQDNYFNQIICTDYDVRRDIQMLLDVAGLEPGVVGFVSDFLNAGIYAYHSEWVNAILYILPIIPAGGFMVVARRSAGNIPSGSVARVITATNRVDDVYDITRVVTRSSSGVYSAPTETLNLIGRFEARGVDFSRLSSSVVSSSPSVEGGISRIILYSDSRGTRFMVNEATDNAGNIIRRDFNAVRIQSGHVINATRQGSRSVGRGYDSFDAFKRAEGPAGEGMAWHHIVEQSQIQRSGFSATDVHNTRNVVSVESGFSGSIHSQLSGHYSSIQPYTNGLTVREWLTGQSFQAQFDYGLQQLSRFGTITPTNSGWIFNPF
jgi:hypothetical protein